jgi:predicted nucleic acid-binding Zn ribbon protein
MRAHRSFLQRLLYSAIYRCHKCGQSEKLYHRHWFVSFHLVFSTHSRCVRCGGVRVYRVLKRDGVDSYSKHPVSLFQKLLFAPLVKCPACRLQFHDFRKPDASASFG